MPSIKSSLASQIPAIYSYILALSCYPAPMMNAICVCYANLVVANFSLEPITAIFPTLTLNPISTHTHNYTYTNMHTHTSTCTSTPTSTPTCTHPHT